MDTIRLVLEQFTNETVNISLSVLALMTFILIAYWYYNRRKFHQLRHQIPASVVKNYLDSIIANSNALKSSLFRGGGLEVGEGIPSILPTSELPTGGATAAGNDNSELIAQKDAEIANLKAIVNQKDITIAELEKMLANAKAEGGVVGMSDEEADILRNEITTLKNQLEEANKALEEAKANSGAGGGEADSVIIKERDELKERLMEYEIIEEDLANLKRYQQENQELKKTIEELKSGGEAPSEEAPAAAAPEQAEAPAEEKPQEEAAPEEAPAEEAAPAQAAAPEEPVEDKTPPPSEEDMDVPKMEGEQKSAEELLSEFEKMLG